MFTTKFNLNNAGCEARTRDLWIMRPTLCRLLSQPGILHEMIIFKIIIIVSAKSNHSVI